MIRLGITVTCLSLLVVGMSIHAVTGFAQEQVETVTDADKVNLWTRDGLDWPSFLGPNRNSQSDETGLRFDWSDEAPEIAWTLRIGEGYGIGSVANGRYFHFDRRRDEARLRAIHAETGQELWQFTYPTDYRDMYGFDGGPRGSPVVDGDRVYIHGVEGRLVCLNAKTGEQIWEVDTAKRFGVIQNFFGVGSTPLIFDGLLIVMIGGSPEESQAVPFGRLDEVKPNGNAIIAFDKMSGEVRYETINDLASYASPVIAEVNGQQTGLAFCRSGLYGFDPANGKVVFEFPYRARKFESVNAATPVVSDSRILITESYGPGGALLELVDGKVETKWADDGARDSVLACHWNTPVVVDGYVYASTGENMATARLVCIRLDDGALMWEQPGLTRSSLALVQGHLICMAEDGRLIVFRPNAEKFELVSEIPKDNLGLAAPCWAAPVISHGFLFVRGKSKVICLDISEK